MTWQAICLTIVKFGMDQVVFASLTANKNIHFSISSLIMKKSGYLSVIVWIIGFSFFNSYVAFALFISILLDTFSALCINELNAHEKFTESSVANLLNYPIFFGGIFISSLFFEMSEIYILVLFCTSSMLRAVWLQLNRVSISAMIYVESKSDVRMGIQQFLNALMFRLDQIILSFPTFHHLLLKERELSSYLLLAKYFEIMASVVPIIGVVIFPTIYLSLAEANNDGSGPRRKQRIVWYGIWLVIVIGLFLGYVTSLSTAKLLESGGLPFALGAFFSLPVNLATYSMLRAQRLDGILRNQILALFIGCLCWLALYMFRVIENLGWLVTFQLFIFATLAKILSWGKETHTYSRILVPSSLDHETIEK
jgi:hypothetical protein